MEWQRRVQVSSRGSLLTLVALAFVIPPLMTACASSQVRAEKGYAAGEQLPRPSVVLVYDFAVHPRDVEVDTLGPDALGGDPQIAERIRVGRVAANALSEQLVIKIQELGLLCHRASASTRVPLHALMIRGQFVSVDEGDMMKRTVIGFGLGSSEVRTRFQIYQQTSEGPRLLGEAETVAQGSKKPGLAGPGAVAGATGQVAGVVVGGVAGGVSEIRGGVEADAKRSADAIAERLSDVFVSKGWI